MKKVDSRGFIIYSNFQTSKKSRDLATNPRAALNFWWENLERQVRIEGTTERLTPEESQEYASTRPRNSQLGAWASPQSQVIEGRHELDTKVQGIHKQFEGTDDIPVPPFWGGLRIVPDVVEFWQGFPSFEFALMFLGRPNRLHDRFVYEKQDSGEWTINRLAP
jgi:pyridoxamine 5'-phosphate oxidase